MKSIVRYLAGALLVTAEALGVALPQDASQELRLKDIRAQQPEEKTLASTPCQRARSASQGWFTRPYAIDPKTLVPDLNTLMEKSDEVVLAGSLDYSAVLSPSGESVALYYEVRVVRSWKGQHRAGDLLTFGMPFGDLPCEPRSQPQTSYYSVKPGEMGVTAPMPYAFVLFLRRATGSETQLVQGFLPAAGEGVQGMFLVAVPDSTYDEPKRECAGNYWAWQRCNAYLETSQSPVMVPYAHDPLATRYGGMPISSFLREVQSLAAAR